MRASRIFQRMPLRIRSRALVFVEGRGQAHRKASYPQRPWHLLLFLPARVQPHKGYLPKSNPLPRQIHLSIRLPLFPQNLLECWKTSSLLRAAHLLLPYPAPLILRYLAPQPTFPYQARLHPYLPLKVESHLFLLCRARGDQAQWGIHEANPIQGVSVLLAQWVTAVSSQKPQ